MHANEESRVGRRRRASRRQAPDDPLSRYSDYLLASDLLCVLGSAALSALLYARWFAALTLDSPAGNDTAQVALIGFLLAPLLLYDRRGGAGALLAGPRRFLLALAPRVVVYAGAVLAIAHLARVLPAVPTPWLLAWFAGVAVLAAGARVLLLRVMEHRQRAPSWVPSPARPVIGRPDDAQAQADVPLEFDEIERLITKMEPPGGADGARSGPPPLGAIPNA